MVRVVSYNIHSGVGSDGVYDLARIAGTLRRSACDIACLQQVEVNFEEKQQRKWSSKHSDNQVEQLARSSGLCFYSFAGPLSAHMGEVDDRPEGRALFNPYEEILVRDKDGRAGFGNAILSRFPILESRHFLFEQEREPLSEDYIYMEREPQPRGVRAVLVDTLHSEQLEENGGSKISVEKTSRNPSMLACCTAPETKAQQVLKNIPSAPLWVITTHLSHRTGSEEQRSQAKQLVEFIDALVQEEDGPVKPGVLLCGDLNAPPVMPRTSYSILSSDSRFRDAWRENGTYCNQATFPMRCCLSSCGLRYDHIFMLDHPKAAKLHSQAIRLLNTGQDADGSDHCAVCADVDLGSE